MSVLVAEFNDYRERMNELILSKNNVLNSGEGIDKISFETNCIKIKTFF